MAVFPTPGSPTRAGLFLFFRLRIPMTISISRSRPITGSMVAAFWIRSSLNCSNSFVETASFFTLAGSCASHFRKSIVLEKISLRSPAVRFSSSWAAVPLCRRSATRTWRFRTSRLPMALASSAALCKMLLAFRVKPWGSGKSGVPHPYKTEIICRVSSPSRPKLRRICPDHPGSSARARRRCSLPT